MFIKFLKKLFGRGDAASSNKQGGWNAEEGVYYAKGSYDNIAEYNNELICIGNVMDDYMTDMNAAMDARDYKRAEEVRLKWLAAIPECVVEAEKLGAYKGDDTLLEALIRHFAVYYDLMEDGYKKLIEFRVAQGYDSAQATEQETENNNKIINSEMYFNEVSRAFLAKFHNE